MEFAYQARDQEGALRTGTVEANTEGNAFQILEAHGLIVIKVTLVTRLNLLGRLVLFEGVSSKDKVLFSRQLATLIDAKVPIVQSLKILQVQVGSLRLRRIIVDIGDKVEGGQSLSTAMAAYPKVFSDLYVNLVRAGELSGTLNDSLTYLANQLERDYDLRSKVIGTLTYPAFIVAALLIVGFLMFIYVLPPLVAILQEATVDLPITTKILIATTNFVQSYWYLVIGIVVGLAVFLRIYMNTYSGRFIIDYTKTKIPLLGRLFRNIYMARFARNLSTLVAGGIPIVKALDSVADIVGNQVYKDIILDASTQVRNGKTIAATIAEHEEFPLIVSQMTQIGETTGRLRDILEKLALFYEKEVEVMLSVLTTLIEPMIMILLGFAVAIMVAGILLPIYNLAGAA